MSDDDIPTHLGDPFAVVCHPYYSEVEVVYEDLRFASISAVYARTFAAALLAAADRVEALGGVPPVVPLDLTVCTKATK